MVVPILGNSLLFNNKLRNVNHKSYLLNVLGFLLVRKLEKQKSHLHCRWLELEYIVVIFS